MTWDDLKDLLIQEMLSLKDPPISDAELVRTLTTSSNALPDWAESTAVGLDAAIRMFSRTRSWPALNDNERTLLWWRLQSAFHYADYFDQAQKHGALGVSSPTLDEEDLIEWVLSGCAGRVAYAYMLESLEAFYRGTVSASGHTAHSDS